MNKSEKVRESITWGRTSNHSGGDEKVERRDRREIWWDTCPPPGTPASAPPSAVS